jgi:hypothetical protein
MACYINPHPTEVSKDEFLLILNSNNLYDNYLNIINNNEEGLLNFFKTNENIINEGIKEVKQLRDFKAGKLNNLNDIANNKVINYFINNNINSSILQTLDKAFTDIFYRLTSESTSPVDSFINLNDVFKLSILEGRNTDNVIIRFLAAVNEYKKVLINNLESVTANSKVLTDFDKLNIQQTINYINSLGLSTDLTYPITTLDNFKNNLRLKELINYLGRDGLFKLDTKLIEDLDNEKEDLENNVQIYEKDPLTENPVNKISARLKLMLRGINMYDSLGNKIVKNNVQLFWKPSDLIQKMLTAVSNNNVHNLSIDQIIDKLTVLSNQKNYFLAEPLRIFLQRLNALKNNNDQFKTSVPDIYTDLFLYFQQYPVGIKVLETKKSIVNDSEVTNLVIQNKTDYVNAGLYRVRQDIFESLLNSKELEGNFNTLNELILKPNQSVAQLAEILANLLSPNVAINKDQLKADIFNQLKNTNLTTGVNLLSVLSNIINGDNILNSTIINKVYNINNDNIFPVLNPSELSEQVSIINSSINAIKNGVPFEETDFYKKFKDDIIGMSLWSDYVKNLGNELKISIFLGYNLNNDNKKEYENFTEKELLANLFNIVMSGSIPTPILSDKSNIYLLDNYNYRTTQVNKLSFQEEPISYFKYFINFLKIDSNLNEKINDGGSIGKNMDKAIAKQKLVLFNPEFYEIAKNSKVLELYDKYNNGSKEDKEFAKKELINIIAQFQNILGDQLLKKFTSTGLIKYDDELGGYISTDPLLSGKVYYGNQDASEELINDIKTVAVKYFVFNTHLKLLTTGHPGFFKENDEQKRVKAIVADTKKPNINATYKGTLAIKENKGRRIILKDVEVALINKSIQEFFLSNLKANKNSKQQLLEKMANLFSNYTLLDGTPVYSLESNKLDKIKQDFEEETKELQEQIKTLKEQNNTKELEEAQNKYNKILKTYSDLEKTIEYLPTKKSNTTDASSLSSLDFSKQYHIGLNMYSDDQESFYDAETKGRFLDKFTKNNFRTIKNLVFTKIKGVKASANEEEGILKPYMEKTSTDNFTAQRVFLGKSPNIYQAMIGKMFGYTFDEKNKSWTYNPDNAIIDKIVYESAVKAEVPVNAVGNVAIFDLLKEINDKNITTLDDVNNWKPEENFANNYVIDIPITEDRMQVETPEHLEGQSDIGTQIENLINNGIDPNVEYSINNKTFNGLDLTNLLNELKITYVESGKERLFNDFFQQDKVYDLIASLYDQRENLNLETLTPEKLPELLNNPQFGLALVSKIQSLIKKDIVKTKINGVQFFNGVTANDTNLNILVEDVTDSEGKVIKKLVFEVAVPAFSEEMFNAALNPETKELDINLIPQELREFVVYRIPTEAMYSMFAVRIKKLLHPAAGPIIYMPDGSTNIAGFDMDIDKLFGIVKNYYSKNNKLVPIEYSLEKDSNINFKEWIKDNITNSDKITLDELYRQKSDLIEQYPEFYEDNKEIKNLLKAKNKIIEDTKKQLEEEFKLTGSTLSRAISDELNRDARYLVIKSSLELFYDSIKVENKEELKNNIKDINKQINDIYSNYKEYWKKLNITGQLSKLQSQNLYLDIISGVITNQKSLNEYITGNNFTRLEQQAEELDNKKSTQKENKSKKLTKLFPYKDSNLLNAINTFKAIMSGAQNIGPAAIFNQFVAVNKFLKNLDPTEENGFKVKTINLLSNNQKNAESFDIFKGLNNYITKSGLEPNMAVATLLAQAVDNIKKDLSVPLNLQKELISLRALLYLIGLDENVVDRIFTDYPKIDQIIKEAIASNKINEFKNNIFKNNLYNLNEKPSKFIYLDENKKVNINLNYLNKAFKPDSTLSDLFGNNVSEDEIIYFLHEMLDLSFDLFNVITTINYVQNGFGKNFSSLVYSYNNAKKLLNNNLTDKFNINLTNSFIEFKLKQLINVSDNIYKLFNINLENSNFNFFKNYFKVFNNPKYAGYLFRANLSLNIYLNLITEFGSSDNIKKAYFKEINDLKLILGQNSIVEKTPEGYVKSKNQNLNLSTLNNIVRFIDNNIYFQDNIQNITELKQLYPFDVQFLGQNEEFNNSFNPKNIIDVMSTDTKTLYFGGNTDLIDDSNVFTAQEVAQKLFFINMIQSAIFSGKNNKGRSNVFDLLFLDNIILQNFILYLNNPYSYYVNNSLFNDDVIKNDNTILNSLSNFIILNNPDIMSKYNKDLSNTFLLSRANKQIISNSLLKTEPVTLNNSLVNVQIININNLIDTDNKVIKNKIDKFLSSNYITVNDKGVQYIFQKIDTLNENQVIYKNLGILNSRLVKNSFNAKINPIEFKFLDDVVTELGITTSNIDIQEFNSDLFIQQSPNFKNYGLPKYVNFKTGLETDQILLQKADGVITEVDKKLKDYAYNNFESFSKDIDITKNDELIKAKYKKEDNQTILLSRTNNASDVLSDELKDLINLHIKFKNKFIFNNNMSNKPLLDYLISKNYNNFEVYGINGNNTFNNDDVKIALTNIKESNEPEITPVIDEEEFTNVPPCIKE